MPKIKTTLFILRLGQNFAHSAWAIMGAKLSGLKSCCLGNSYTAACCLGCVWNALSRGSSMQIWRSRVRAAANNAVRGFDSTLERTRYCSYYVGLSSSLKKRVARMLSACDAFWLTDVIRVERYTRSFYV